MASIQVVTLKLLNITCFFLFSGLHRAVGPRTPWIRSCVGHISGKNV